MVVDVLGVQVYSRYMDIRTAAEIVYDPTLAELIARLAALDAKAGQIGTRGDSRRFATERRALLAQIKAAS